MKVICILNISCYMTKYTIIKDNFRIVICIYFSFYTSSMKNLYIANFIRTQKCFIYIHVQNRTINIPDITQSCRFSSQYKCCISRTLITEYCIALLVMTLKKIYKTLNFVWFYYIINRFQNRQRKTKSQHSDIGVISRTFSFLIRTSIKFSFFYLLNRNQQLPLMIYTYFFPK